MRASFALHPAAAKRIIARGVVNLPEVRNALQNGRIIIGAGTTNAFIVEELTGQRIEEKTRYAAGIICDHRLCLSEPRQRINPVCLYKGQPVEAFWEDFLKEFGPDDVFIKGANAIDAFGRAGVLLGSPLGGTVGAILGILASRGSKLIIPVGHEKMIPSCAEASEMMGIGRLDYSLGMKTGFMELPFGLVFTEVDALELLYGVRAVVVAAGGVGGSEGSVVVAIEGTDESVKTALNEVKKALKEKPIKGGRLACKDCPSPCYFVTAK